MVVDNLSHKFVVYGIIPMFSILYLYRSSIHLHPRNCQHAHVCVQLYSKSSVMVKPRHHDSNHVRGVLKIYEEPESPNEEACLRDIMNSKRPNEKACSRYMRDRNRQRRRHVN